MRCEEREGEGVKERGHERGEEQEVERGEKSRLEGTVERQEESGEKRGYETDEEREHEMEAGEEETEAPIDYYIRPNRESLRLFFAYHPKQNANNPVVQRVFWCKNGTNRRWLTYCQEGHTLHCSVCMAFGKSTDSSPFISGMADCSPALRRT